MQTQDDALQALVRAKRRKKLEQDLHDEQRQLDATHRKFRGMQDAAELNEWPQVHTFLF